MVGSKKIARIIYRCDVEETIQEFEPFGGTQQADAQSTTYTFGVVGPFYLK